MLESKYIDTSTKEGRKAQRLLLSALKDIKALLSDCGIDVWCINRYSYRAEYNRIDKTIDFEIYLPKATQTQHDLAVEIIEHCMLNIKHKKQGKPYFVQLHYGEDSLSEYITHWATHGNDNCFEEFRFYIE